MFTSREIIERLDFDIYRWRQLTRQFLPADPEAGRRSGKTRLFPLEDILLVEFADRLLKAQFPSNSVKQILTSLKSYFVKNKYFPLSNWDYFNPPMIIDDDGKPLRSILRFLRTKTGYMIQEELNDMPVTGSFWGTPDQWQIKRFKFKDIESNTESTDCLYYVEVDLTVEIRGFLAIFK